MDTKRKMASQRYRVKKRQETKDMKQEICGLRSEVVVLKFVNEQYKKENNDLRKQLADHMDSCICNMVKTIQLPTCSRQIITCMPSVDENDNYDIGSYGSSQLQDVIMTFRDPDQTSQYLPQGINV